ncbi:MAG TPA: fibronectin type III domain-containing protein [Candidatus Thermoplasmatota archaeon]|nr:fibronectin type III domain-containing protein [Candidatus Thermoplasmatota archaeon]
MASYVVAAALFVMGASYLIQFVVEPPGSSVSNLEHIDLKTQAQQAMGVMLGTPGWPDDWDADAASINGVDRLGLIEKGSSIRIDAEKFDALARGRYDATDNRNTGVDYGEAKAALGLDGYEFHLRAYPVTPDSAGNAYGVSGMDDFHVGYVGDQSGAAFTTTSQAESSALENISVMFVNKTRASLATGDVYMDTSSDLIANLLPNLGVNVQQEVIGAGAGTKFDFYRVNDTSLEGLLTLTPSSDVSTSMALSSNGVTLGYTKNRELRAIVGSANLLPEDNATIATIRWNEWVDTDRGNGSYDCGDYGWVEVSPNNGATWYPISNSVADRSDECGLPNTASWSARQVDVTKTNCIWCARNASVLVAFHWLADNDNNIGYGWSVDDVRVEQPSLAPRVYMSKTFERPAYDLLVVGSGADHNAFTPNAVKNAIRDYVDLYGGRLLVLGGQQNVQWLDRLFDAGIGSGAGSVSAPDTTHPLLTTPRALDWQGYTPGTAWDFSSSDDAGLFQEVIGTSSTLHHLSVSKQGTFGVDASNDGSVILASYQPGTWDAQETRQFMANAATYGRFHYLYLEVGPDVPDSDDVASVTRSATMNKLRNGSEDYTEMAFVMYVWPGTSVAQTLSELSVNALPPRAVTAEALNHSVRVNWTWPSSNGTVGAKEYLVWRGNSPDNVTTIVKTINVSSFNFTFHDYNVTNGTSYWYNVTLVTHSDTLGDLRGTPSDAVCAVPLGRPDAPTGISATGLASTISVTWSAPGWTGPGQIYGYAVWGKHPADTSYTLVGEIGNATTFLYSPPDTDWWTFTVSALNGAGYGPNSTATVAAKAITQAAGPTLNVTNSSAPLRLTYAPGDLGGSAASGYTIFRSADGTSWLQLAYSNSATNLTWDDANISANATYWYRVAAVTEVGNGLNSSDVSKTSMSPPWQVLGLQRSASVAGVSNTLTWSAPASNGGGAVTSYEIWRGTSAGAETLLDVSPTTLYTDATAASAPHLYYKVRALNAAGAGPFSASLDAGGFASAPGLTATNLTAGNLALAWTPPADVGGDSDNVPNGYKLWRSADGGATWIPLPASGAAVTNLSWTDQNVTANASYAYRAQAVNDQGDGANASATKQALGAPWTVTGLARTGGVDGVSVTLSWSAPSDGGSPITSYTIYRSSDNVTFTSRGTSATTSYIDATLGTIYYYKVYATNLVGTGPGSSSVYAKGPPSAPSPSVTNTTAHRLTISWSAPSQNGGTYASYAIYRSTDQTSWTTIASSSSTNRSWIDLNVSDNTTYYYRVAETNEVGAGTNSSDVSKATIGTAWPPTLTLTNTTANRIGLSWSAPNMGGGTLSSYKIERSTDGSSWSLLATSSLTPTNVSWTDATVSSNSTYYYRVYAVTDGGNGAASTAQSKLTMGVPWGVTGLARTGGVGGVSTIMSWNAPSDGGSAILTYDIEKSSNNVSWSDASPATSVSTSTTQVTGTIYSYRVRANNALGAGPWSSAVYAIGTPSAPAVTISNSTAHQLGLSWSAASQNGGTYTGSTVYRSTDGSTWSTLATTTNATRAWTDANVSDNTTYYYRVAETNSVGAGANSSDVTKTTIGTAWPPTLTLTNTTANQLTLSWTAPNMGGGSLSSYKIERSTDGSSWSLLATSSLTPTNVSWADATVANNSTYYYRVYAVTDGGNGAASTAQSKLSMGVPWAPLNLAKTGGVAGVNVIMSWSAPASNGGSAVLSYDLYRNGTWIGTTTLTTYTYAPPTASAYTYTVRATNAVGGGALSTGVSMTR